MKKYLLIPILLSVFSIHCNSSILDDPSTIINFSIPEPSHVKLTIENSYNTTIATLSDHDREAGAYNISYSTSGLLEGIYFYTLEVKGLNSSYYSKETKFMILVK